MVHRVALASLLLGVTLLCGHAHPLRGRHDSHTHEYEDPSLHDSDDVAVWMHHTSTLAALGQQGHAEVKVSGSSSNGSPWAWFMRVTSHRHPDTHIEEEQVVDSNEDYDEAGGDWMRAYESEYHDIPSQLRAALAAHEHTEEVKATAKQHSEVDELEAQELHQDLEEIMRDNLLHNLAAEVGAVSASSRTHTTTQAPHAVLHDSDAVTESGYDDDVEDGETDMMVMYTSDDVRDEDDVYKLHGSRGGVPYSIITIHPLSSLSHLVSTMLSWGQQHFPLTMVHPIDAYNHAFAEHDMIVSVEEEEAPSGGRQLPVSQGKMFSGSTGSLPHSDIAAAMMVVDPHVEQASGSGTWWQWWQDVMNTKNGQLLQLMCLLAATVVMLVGFVSALLSLKRVMRGRELLVPFTIQHEGGVQHGYMVLDEEQLAAAGLDMEAGAGGKAGWAQSDAWQALEEEKTAAKAAWDKQDKQ